MKSTAPDMSNLVILAGNLFTKDLCLDSPIVHSSERMSLTVTIREAYPWFMKSLLNQEPSGFPWRVVAALGVATILFAAALMAGDQVDIDSTTSTTFLRDATPTVTPKLSSIRWPKAIQDNEVRTALTPELVTQIDSASLPVLIPGDPEFLEKLTIRSSSSFYSASLFEPNLGISFSIMGTRLAFVPPSTAPSLEKGALGDTVRGVPASIRQSEGMWSLTWEQYGAAYLIKLDCDTNVTTRCEDDSYLRVLAEELAFVGGTP